MQVRVATAFVRIDEAQSGGDGDVGGVGRTQTELAFRAEVAEPGRFVGGRLGEKTTHLARVRSVRKHHGADPREAVLVALDLQVPDLDRRDVQGDRGGVAHAVAAHRQLDLVLARQVGVEADLGFVRRGERGGKN